MNDFMDELLDKHPALFFLVGWAGGTLFLLFWGGLIGLSFMGQVLTIGLFSIAVVMFYGFETGKLR